MRNPFRSEARAFQFVGPVAVAAVVVIIVNAFASTAAVVAVSVLAVAGVAALYLLRGRRPARIRSAPAHVGPPAERRVLLLLDESPEEASLSDLGRNADRVLVVALPRPSQLQHWVSDVDGAQEEARGRMEAAVSHLRALDVDASGVVGDDDPFAAVDDALRTFGGDEIVVASHDAELIGGLSDRYAIPVAPAAAA
jgi:hypothetical protein